MLSETKFRFINLSKIKFKLKFPLIILFFFFSVLFDVTSDSEKVRGTAFGVFDFCEDAKTLEEK